MASVGLGDSGLPSSEEGTSSQRPREAARAVPSWERLGTRATFSAPWMPAHTPSQGIAPRPKTAQPGIPFGWGRTRGGARRCGTGGSAGDPLLWRGHRLLRPPHRHTAVLTPGRSGPSGPGPSPAHRPSHLSALGVTPGGLLTGVWKGHHVAPHGAGVGLCLLVRPLSIRWPSSSGIPMLPAPSQDPATPSVTEGCAALPPSRNIASLTTHSA